MYIIKSGKIKVEVDGKEVAMLVQFEAVGELSLLKKMPRAATCTCAEDVEVLKIARKEFYDAGLAEKLVFKKRDAVGAGGAANVEIKKPTQKSGDDIKKILTALG